MGVLSGELRAWRRDFSRIALLTMPRSSSNGCAMAYDCEFVFCQGDFEGIGENTSAMGHLLSHEQNNLSIHFVRFPQRLS